MVSAWRHQVGGSMATIFQALPAQRFDPHRGVELTAIKGSLGGIA
jgi:hypothetical protein